MEVRKRFRTPCDKNTIWKKIEKVVELWCDCIDKEMVQEFQLVTFKKLLMGSLLVEHNEGRCIKLFKEMYNGERRLEYTLLRRAMDFSGIPENCMSNKIRRITVYPSGALKIEYAGKKQAEWQ